MAFFEILSYYYLPPLGIQRSSATLSKTFFYELPFELELDARSIIFIIDQIIVDRAISIFFLTSIIICYLKVKIMLIIIHQW